MNTSRRMILLGAIPVLLLTTLTGSAQAETRPQIVFGSDLAAAAKPTSNIITGPLRFSPTGLTAKRSGTDPSATCTVAKAAFIVVNRTTRPRVVVVGKVSARVPVNAGLAICVSTPNPGTRYVHLAQNPSVELTVKIT